MKREMRGYGKKYEATITKTQSTTKKTSNNTRNQDDDNN